MKRAVFPGSFDPPTNGHLNIIQRASSLFQELMIVIAVNSGKGCLFTPEERRDMMISMTKNIPQVSVHLWDKLIVEFCRQNEAPILLRGVRALTDFNYEFELSMMNRQLDPDVETLFIPTDQKYFVLRSSSIKELAGLNGDFSRMVPPVVARALKRKFPVSKP